MTSQATLPQSRPMKIMSILASPAAGGAEMLVRNLSAEFAARGHGAHITFMSDAASVGNPAGFEREFLAGLDEAGVTHDRMGTGVFRRAISGARAIRRSVKAIQPDLLHIHLARGLMARSLSGLRVPTVYTHHNVTTNFPAPLFRWFDLNVDHYVAIGAACRALLELNVRRRIASIPNGVPASFSRGRPRTGVARDPFILAVGNLNPKKDYPGFVEAAAAVAPRLAAQGRAVRFAIAGEGPEREKIARLIEARGLTDRFELLGARPDVAELMAEADLLVNSSAHEGLPITLIEAAMSGLPAVVSDVGGNAEVVRDGSSGFVVPPGRPDRMAERIAQILSDETLHRRFSEAAIDHSRRFTLAACADAHIELYESVLASRRR